MKKVIILYLVLTFTNTLFAQLKIASMAMDEPMEEKVFTDGTTFPAVTIDQCVLLVKNAIDSIRKNHGEFDVLVLPEYAMYVGDKSGFTTDFGVGAGAVKLNKIGNHYELSNDSYSITKNAIEEIQGMAAANNIYILLGTAPVEFPISTIDYPNLADRAVFNTLLIIDRKGEIIDYDLKVKGSDWIDLPPGSLGTWDSEEVTNDAVRFTNTTTRVRYFTALSGETFSYIPTICAESWEQVMHDVVAGKKADLYIHVESEGDFRYDKIALSIANGTPIDKISLSIFDGNYRDSILYSRELVRPDSYFVGSESVYAFAGIFRFDLKPIGNYDSQKSYVYSELPKNSNSTSINLAEEASSNSIDISLSDISVYPNPVTGDDINIEFTNDNLYSRVDIFDILGKIKISEKLRLLKS